MKKVVTLFLSLVLIALLSLTSFATGITFSQSQTEIDAINIKNIASYTTNFIDTVYNNSDLEVCNVFTFYSENDKIAGYCVDIKSGEIPYGYVIVKFSNNEPVISEFCIGEDIKNPYDAILTTTDGLGDELKFYSIGSNNYQILDLSKNIVVYDTHETVSRDRFETFKANVITEKQYATVMTSDENRLNYSDLDGITVVSDDYEGEVLDGRNRTITGAGDSFSWYCDTDVTAINGEYACSVVALCNLMKYYRSIGYSNISASFSTLYSTLWDYAATETDGSTANGNEPMAAQTYLLSLGYGCTYNGYLFDTYDNITADLSLNKPCIFTYGAQFYGKAGGHAVLAVGFVETTAYQYLRIADGWNNYSRYINFNGYDYTRKDAWPITASFTP